MNAFRGKLLTLAAIRLFLEAGNATLTIQSKKSQERFTFRFRRPDDAPTGGRERCIWVSLLNGPDNEANYAFIGTIFPTRSTTEVRSSARSRVGLDSPSGTALQWMLRQVYLSKSDHMFTQAELWHEGVCGKCGRKLTVPESIETGFGPECSSRLGIARKRPGQSDLELGDPEKEAAPWARPQ